MLFRTYLEALMRQQPKFGRASAVYAFTTENLGGHFPELEIEGRTVLTVCGSGDHILNAILCGASSVTAFDVNSVALLWAQLKLAAVKVLDYQGYKDFFLREEPSGAGLNPRALRCEVFSQIKKELSSETAAFFEILYAAFQSDGAALRESAFFNNRFDTNAAKLASNLYLLDEENYEKAARAVCASKVEYRDCSVMDVVSREQGRQYDIIVLSNLCDYAESMFGRGIDAYEKYFQGLCRGMLEILSAEGVICAAYLYGQPENAAPHSELDIEEKRATMLQKSGFEYREIRFRGMREGLDDIVVLLSRREYDGD